jgi:uncharacterized protein (DUF302 family)
MTQTTIDYGFCTRLQMPYEEAIPKVTDALKKEGFGVLTQIDMKATLKNKLDVDFRKYIILGACNPPLANKALAAELEIGLLLPCNVIVYEDDEQVGSVVSIVNPMQMLGVVDNPTMDSIAHEVQDRLQRVMNSLS